MAIVYIHRRKDIQDPFLNVFYVGIGKTNKRANETRKRNSLWNRVIQKHGYSIEITHIDLCWEEVCVIEKYLISFYGRHDLGLGNLANMTDGGDGRINHIKSKEEIEKRRISITGKGNPMYGRVGAQKGKKGFNTGNKCTDEIKRKISASSKGIKRSEETKRKMSIAQKIRFEDPKAKIMLGKKHTIETRLKMKLYWQKRKENENIIIRKPS